MDPSVQIPEVVLQIPPIVLPRHAVHPGRGPRVQRPIGRPEAIDIDVMQERGEPRLLVRAAPFGARDPAHWARLARLCVRGAFCWPRFPRPASFPPPPPPPVARSCSAASQVLRGRLTSRDRPSRDYRLSVSLTDRPAVHATPRPIKDGASTTGAANHGISPFSRMELPRMPRFTDRAGSDDNSR